MPGSAGLTVAGIRPSGPVKKLLPQNDEERTPDIKASKAIMNFSGLSERKSPLTVPGGGLFHIDITLKRAYGSLQTAARLETGWQAPSLDTHEPL